METVCSSGEFAMLRLTGVSVTYPNGVCGLEETSVAFAKGQFTVLLGPSGSGKSTLLRTLNGLVRPTAGDAAGPWGPIGASGPLLRRHRRSTGMIFQHHHLIGRLTVLRNVLMGRIGHQSALRSVLPPSRGDRLLALRILDRLGMADRALDRADQLSGGQQQRVGIARALAQTPQIILADEPIASLDPASAEQVLSDLHRICREDGITAVLSLHQLDFARRFADRIVGLRKGQIVFDGLPRELTPAVAERIYGASEPPMARAAE